jgi:4'-phosphopantetheinyl transferase EntD
VLAALLPADVAVAEATALLEAAAHRSDDAALLGGASPGREAEFLTGRHLARRALRRLGAPDVPIARGADRQPLWPPGIVGSITHCAGYCAAAVAAGDAVASVGIDAEPHGPLAAGVLDRIALPDELAWIRAHAGAGVHWDRLLFCAKEAVFKTWFPLTGRWLGFDGARITFEPSGTAFEAELLVAPPHVNGVPAPRFPGRYAVGAGHVVTAVALPTAGLRRPLGPRTRQCTIATSIGP